MNSLIKSSSKTQLNFENLQTILNQIKHALDARVSSAYVFGSASEGTFHKDSDIDLILIIPPTDTPFLQRALLFSDLYDIYANLDLLVYTQSEFDAQLADSDIGFWKSVRLSMKPL